MNPSYESYGTGDAWADWESPYQLDWVDWSTIQSAPGLDPTNSIFPHGSATFEGIDSAWTDSGSRPTFQPALITDNSSQGLRALHYGQQADAEAIPTPMPVCFSLDVTQDTWLTTPCCWSGAGASANVDSTYITDGVELAPQPDHYEPASLTTLPPTSDVGAPSDFFQQLPTSRLDPPLDDSQANASLRKQKPRSEGDLYAAQWIRGERSDRAGWCGYCCLWFKLKDSAYWYHMHYTHGISCVSGQQYPPPESTRRTNIANEWEALCRACRQWVTIGRGTRCRAGFYRHAYKCYGSRQKSPRRVKSRSTSRSPKKLAALPVVMPRSIHVVSAPGGVGR